MAGARFQNRLVVTADDFGLSHEVNEAVELAHRNGVLSAASLMVAGAAAADAIRRARAMPSLRVGLHLVLVEDRPVLPPAQLSRLCDHSGRFRRDMMRSAIAIAFDPRASRQLDREIRAQFEAYARTGLQLDHVDAHKHFHLHPRIAKGLIAIGRPFGMRALRTPVEDAAVLAAAGGETATLSSALFAFWARRLRARARRAGLVTPDSVFGLRWTGALDAQRLCGILDNLPAGLVEIYAHPAVDDTFPDAVSGSLYRREFEALCDPGVREALLRSGRPLGGYSDALA